MDYGESGLPGTHTHTHTQSFKGTDRINGAQGL